MFEDVRGFLTWIRGEEGVCKGIFFFHVRMYERCCSLRTGMRLGLGFRHCLDSLSRRGKGEIGGLSPLSGMKLMALGTLLTAFSYC